MRRRQFLIASTGIAVLGGCRSSRATSPLETALARLERQRGGRLGVMAVELGSGRSLEHRSDERFPMCSTFKTLLAAAVLGRTGDDQAGLDRTIRYGTADLLAHAPVTRKNVARGQMSVGELCEAAVTLSDNTAANLLLADLGGLASFNDYVRRLGDRVTRLDRLEPALNEAAPGDPRDTTTPRAMAENLKRLFVGEALPPLARERLVGWHRRAAVGQARLRAGLPGRWSLAHKTGTGGHGATNDIGVAWPPGRGPLIVAAYYAESEAPLPSSEAVLAEVGRNVAEL
jgi:beta-lactamase class A